MIIPERQDIYKTLKSKNKALDLDEIAVIFSLTDDQKQAIGNRLEAMVRDGQLVHAAQDTYLPGLEAQRATGTFIVSARGMSVKVDSADGTYLEIPQRLAHGLIDGDEVAVYTLRENLNKDISLIAVELLERDREIVGVVTERGYIDPLHEIGVNKVRVVAGKYFPKNVAVKAGSIVTMRLRKPEFRSSTVAGEILEVLGDCEHAGIEVDIVLRAYGIRSRWHDKILDETKHCKAVSQQDIAERKDLRAMDFITIDGEDAKDFDDAICFEKNNEEWNLWVAIADVANYIKPGSALDCEACARGNSVYFPGRVVPMLPPVLSDDLCSLRPGEERLALVCKIKLSHQGEIINYEFMKAVIFSKARLTYTEVGQFLQNNKGLEQCSISVKNMLCEGLHLLKLLSEQRKKRYALELDTVETRMLFNKQGMIRQIVPFERNDAHRLIEESMICANICAARFLAEHRKNLLYRVHVGLKKEAIEDLKFFVREQGFTLRGESNQDLASLLAELTGKDKAYIVQIVILRSLAKALYQSDNLGHYGLALESYAHFTSPIRRYPDLLIHRAIHAVLNEGKSQAHSKTYDEDELKEIGEHCSMTEKRADDATRDVEKYLKCLFIRDKVGEKFAGTIMGVTNFGLFIEIEKLYIEGLLHISSLENDYYIFDSQRHCLTGKSKGKLYKLGDQIVVTLSSVIPEERKIDFVLKEHNKTKRSSGHKRR